MRYGERKTVLRDARRRTTAAEDDKVILWYHGTDQHQPVSISYIDHPGSWTADGGVQGVVPIGPHIVVFTDSGVYTRNDSL